MIQYQKPQSQVEADSGVLGTDTEVIPYAYKYVGFTQALTDATDPSLVYIRTIVAETPAVKDGDFRLLFYCSKDPGKPTLDLSFGAITNVSGGASQILTDSSSAESWGPNIASLTQLASGAYDSKYEFVEGLFEKRYLPVSGPNTSSRRVMVFQDGLGSVSKYPDLQLSNATNPSAPDPNVRLTALFSLLSTYFSFDSTGVPTVCSTK